MTQSIPQLIVKDPGDISPSRGVCIYGRSGVGKTFLLGTMPGRGLVIDVPQVEGGTEVIADKADRIKVTTVETWEELDTVFKFLQRGDHPYQWAAMDSATAAQKLAIRKVVKERDLASDPHKITQQEYGVIGGLMSELFYRFRTLKILTIWIAQERHHNSETDESSLLGPDVTPMALQALMPSMMFVARLFVTFTLGGSVERQLLVGPHPNYLTKCRARPGITVPGTIRNPNLEVLFKYLMGKAGIDQLDLIDESSLMMALT